MAKPALLQRLEAHFRDDPARLPVVEQHVAVYERPNLHLAIDELVRSTNITESASIAALTRYWHCSTAEGAAGAARFDSKTNCSALLI